MLEKAVIGKRLLPKSRWFCLGLLALVVSGCEFVGTVIVRTGEGALKYAVDSRERRKEARQVRIEWPARPAAERSSYENRVLQLASGSSPIKDVFCGKPPDLDHLPAEAFDRSVFEPDPDPNPACEALVNEKMPDWKSCYLLFENGDTSSWVCHTSTSESETGIECDTLMDLVWELVRDRELRELCPPSIQHGSPRPSGSHP